MELNVFLIAHQLHFCRRSGNDLPCTQIRANLKIEDINPRDKNVINNNNYDKSVINNNITKTLSIII